MISEGDSSTNYSVLRLCILSTRFLSLTVLLFSINVKLKLVCIKKKKKEGKKQNEKHIYAKEA